MGYAFLSNTNFAIDKSQEKYCFSNLKEGGGPRLFKLLKQYFS